MVAGGSYPCDEHMIKYRDLDSLCCTPEINETLYINYTQIIFFFFFENRVSLSSNRNKGYLEK